jgi:hypothetical protein
VKSDRWRSWAIGAVVGLLCGLWFGWSFWHHAPVVEGEAIARTLPSGGTLVERDPHAHVPKTVVQAAREAGGKLVRSVSLTVQPQAMSVSTPSSEGGKPEVADIAIGEPNRNSSAPPACSCAPVTIDLGLIRMPDETRRVVAMARGGEILSAIDIPIETAQPRVETHWAAGVLYEPRRREYGAFLDRDLGPLRLGVQVERRDGRTATWVRAGVRF